MRSHAEPTVSQKYLIMGTIGKTTLLVYFFSNSFKEMLSILKFPEIVKVICRNYYVVATFDWVCVFLSNVALHAG